MSAVPVKLLASGQTEVRKFPSGPELTGQQMVKAALALTADWEFDVVSIGFPSLVVDGRPHLEPFSLSHGGVGYDFAAHLGRPVKIINDAAMQALASYEGCRMLFLGLGTGLGSTLIVGKRIIPLDLGQLPFRDRNLNDYLSRAAFKSRGRGDRFDCPQQFPNCHGRFP